MSPNQLIYIFKRMFPGLTPMKFVNKGRNSVKLTVTTGPASRPCDVIFTYKDPTDWRLEPARKTRKEVE